MELVIKRTREIIESNATYKFFSLQDSDTRFNENDPDHKARYVYSQLVKWGNRFFIVIDLGVTNFFKLENVTESKFLCKKLSMDDVQEVKFYTENYSGFQYITNSPINMENAVYHHSTWQFKRSTIGNIKEVKDFLK